jgi:hypothetical protein
MRDDVFGNLCCVGVGHPVRDRDLTTAELDAVTVRRATRERFNKWTRQWTPYAVRGWVAMCKRCVVLFHTGRRDTVWCSDACMLAAARDRKPPTTRPPVVCECGRGIVVPAATGRTPRHCSAACRQRAYRARRATTTTT